MTVKIEGDDELMAILNKLPTIFVASGGPLDNAVRKAGGVVAKRARQIAPDSRQTGSRDKQSAKSKKDWPEKLNKTIRTKVVKYEQTAVAVVGPKAPEGNMAHFMQEKGRRLVLWGKSTLIALYRINQNWITKAVDETKEDQRREIATSLKADLDKVMSGR